MSTESKSEKSRVLLIEDHAVVRQGLKMLIDDEKDLMVCGGADNLKNAFPLVNELNPDVVVVDIALGDGSGLELIKKIHEAKPTLPMLALSMHDETIYAERALRAGAKGYVMKKEAMDRVLTAIRRVLSGELYLSDAMSARMLRKMVHPEQSRDVSPTEALTDREFEVFNLLARGVPRTEIAEKLSVSVKTIETHREHIKEKLGLKTGTELTRFGVQWLMQHG